MKTPRVSPNVSIVPQRTRFFPRRSNSFERHHECSAGNFDSIIGLCRDEIHQWPALERAFRTSPLDVSTGQGKGNRCRRLPRARRISCRASRRSLGVAMVAPGRPTLFSLAQNSREPVKSFGPRWACRAAAILECQEREHAVCVFFCGSESAVFPAPRSIRSPTTPSRPTSPARRQVWWKSGPKPVLVFCPRAIPRERPWAWASAASGHDVMDPSTLPILGGRETLHGSGCRPSLTASGTGQPRVRPSVSTERMGGKLSFLRLRESAVHLSSAPRCGASRVTGGNHVLSMGASFNGRNLCVNTRATRPLVENVSGARKSGR